MTKLEVDVATDREQPSLSVDAVAPGLHLVDISLSLPRRRGRRSGIVEPLPS